MKELDVDELAAFLSYEGNASPCVEFDPSTDEARKAGLYSWWVDHEGAATLSQPFGVALPSLIYAGQAGASSAVSGVEPSSTLGSRIVGQHLGGNVNASTFRKTMASILLESLRLEVTSQGRLEQTSNRQLTDWMRRHLRVAIAPVSDRTTLADVESRVLALLDPPLNLQGRPRTATRRSLTQLRRALAVSPVARPAGSWDPTCRPKTGSAASRMTLHEAMAAVLVSGGWQPFDEVARRIADGDLYRRTDGRYAEAWQLKLRVTASGGRHHDRFEVAGDLVRLRPRSTPASG